LDKRQWSLAEVNAFDRDTFVAALGGLFEGSPWIAAETWDMRPFADLNHLHRALCGVMYQAPVEQQVALIQAHPDLVGRAALAGTLTHESTREQAAAGLDRLTPDEIATFARLNQEYRDRFGFPFVICARENKKAGILAGFAARLPHSREAEIATALGEIAKIARLRLLDAVRMA
jgi:OHCU decarboxylase